MDGETGHEKGVPATNQTERPVVVGIGRPDISQPGKAADVVLDPDGQFTMLKQPVAKISAGAAALLAYGWDSGNASGIYAIVKSEQISSAPLMAHTC